MGGVDIAVHRLSACSLQSGVPVRVVADQLRAHDIFQYSHSGWVRPYIFIHELGLQRRCLVHVSRLSAEVEVMIGILDNFFCFRAEDGLQGIDMICIDGVG